MRLADFILTNREPILVEWEAFARTCAPASRTMDIAALRDHAGAMLTAIAADLGTAQSSQEQEAKSQGHMRPAGAARPTAAAEHGAGRAESGFSIDQMVAEYRALRASVIRLWTRAERTLDAADLDDIIRFNEAIDQALAESVARYDDGVEQAKETFLAIVGHDLRTPLGAIHSAAAFMLETGELNEPHRTLTARIAGSAKRTLTMVGDLLDFTRSRLGGGIPVALEEMSLGKVVHDAVDEVAAANPRCPIRVETRGEQRGRWDAARLSQALVNLIGNAAQHGSAGSPVSVEVWGEDAYAVVSVHNHGAPIPSEKLDGLFNPMRTRQSPRPMAPGGPTGGLGLGLYIAERIVAAHSGRIAVESTEDGGTRFTIHLPRG